MYSVGLGCIITWKFVNESLSQEFVSLLELPLSNMKISESLSKEEGGLS